MRCDRSVAVRSLQLVTRPQLTATKKSWSATKKSLWSAREPTRPQLVSACDIRKQFSHTRSTAYFFVRRAARHTTWRREQQNKRWAGLFTRTRAARGSCTERAYQHNTSVHVHEGGLPPSSSFVARPWPHRRTLSARPAFARLSGVCWTAGAYAGHVQTALARWSVTIYV